MSELKTDLTAAIIEDLAKLNMEELSKLYQFIRTDLVAEIPKKTPLSKNGIFKVIDSFAGEFDFLSNFYMRPFVYMDKEWPSSEHAYQAMKTDWTTEQERIRLEPTPGKAKRRGQNLTLRFGWGEDKKVVFMFEILMEKFGQNSDLGKKLLDTEEIFLIEGNFWHDNIWGDCFCEKCKNIKGKNMLGYLLENVREKLKCSGS